MAIIITGTPATGKTTVAKEMAKKLGYRYVDVNRVIGLHKLSLGYDRKRKCKLIDTAKLKGILVKMIKKDSKLVIDSHLSHYIDPKYVEKCVVTKCGLRKLKNRLKRRGYSKAKIEENMECEIMDVCCNEAKERGHKVKVMET